jgi:hypothetical protein
MYIFPILLGLGALMAVAAGVVDWRSDRDRPTEDSSMADVLEQFDGPHRVVQHPIRFRSFRGVSLPGKFGKLTRLSDDEIARITEVQERESWTTKPERERKRVIKRP